MGGQSGGVPCGSKDCMAGTRCGAGVACLACAPAHVSMPQHLLVRAPAAGHSCLCLQAAAADAARRAHEVATREVELSRSHAANKDSAAALKAQLSLAQVRLQRARRGWPIAGKEGWVEGPGWPWAFALPPGAGGLCCFPSAPPPSGTRPSTSCGGTKCQHACPARLPAAGPAGGRAEEGARGRGGGR